LADHLGRQLRAAPADPFAEDLVLTRSGGLQRWLAQRCGSWLGTSGHHDGIAARIRFSTLAEFAATVRGKPSDWSPNALFPQIMIALDQLPDDPVFAPVRAHLADPALRPHRKQDFSWATARRFAAYVTWNHDMLRCWQQGVFVLPDQAALPETQWWQPRLWNLVCQQIGTTVHQDLADIRQRLGDEAPGFARIALFCPDTLSPADEQIIAQLDEIHPLMVFACRQTPVGAPAIQHLTSKFTRQSGATEASLDRLCPYLEALEPSPPDAGPATLLARVQRLVTAGELHQDGPDDSIQVHVVRDDCSVEALSETLVGLLARDPTLEPRDLLVLVHQLDRHRPAFDAFFRSDDSPGASIRHGLRVSLAVTEPDPSPVVETLLFLTGLVGSRATADDLNRLCRLPAVMAHFGFAETDLDRLSTLIAASGIRWGVNAALRESDDMAQFAHNTWMAGLGRLVLGVALREDDLVYRGTILPLDVTDSETVRLVSALGQIVAHVRSCCESWPAPADATGWANRFRTGLAGLVDDGWATGPAGRAIAAFEAGAGGSLTLAEAAASFREAWGRYVRPSWFLNGDLAVVPLGDMALVPHKVIVVFGLDAESFPGVPPADGDDLAAGYRPSAADPLANDRQVFFDALMSCRQTFVVFCANATAPKAVPEVAPLPTPVSDLVALAQQCLRATDRPAGLIRTDSSRPAVPVCLTRRDRWTPTGPDTAARDVTIDEVSDLFANPAAYWLRRQAGLMPSALKELDPLPTQMTVDLSPLDTWQITDRLVRLLLAGQDPDAILQAELRRGVLPPGTAGAWAARDAINRAQDIVQRATAVMAEPLSWRSIDLPGQDLPNLVGQIGVHGHTVLDVLAGRAQARHEMAAWTRLLCLQVVYPDERWQAVIVANRTTVQLAAPAPAQARHYLDDLRRLHRTGLISPLPLPASPGAYFARFRARQLPADMVGVTRRLDDEWKRDPAWPLIWPTPADMQQTPPGDDRPAGESYPSRFLALAHTVYAPMMKAGGVA